MNTSLYYYMGLRLRLHLNLSVAGCTISFRPVVKEESLARVYTPVANRQYVTQRSPSSPKKNIGKLNVEQESHNILCTILFFRYWNNIIQSNSLIMSDLKCILRSSLSFVCNSYYMKNM